MRGNDGTETSQPCARRRASAVGKGSPVTFGAPWPPQPARTSSVTATAARRTIAGAYAETVSNPSTVPLALALREPGVEAAAGRAQVVPQLLVERAHFVAEAEHEVVEPARRVADMAVALVACHRCPALLAGHVARLEERRHGVRPHVPPGGPE